MSSAGGCERGSSSELRLGGADHAEGRFQDAGPPRRVMIVEDDPDIQNALSTLLESKGYAVERCVNGMDALQKLGSCVRPDVILLDLHLPVMDGWQFRAAQRRDALLAGIPVVAMSADDSAQAAAVHAEAYLRKPLQPNELIAAVERVLAEQERRQLTLRLLEAERLAALGRMAAGVGHEINNPLAYVTLNIRTIHEHVAGVGAERWWSALGLSDLPEILSEALEGLERIRRIVEDLRMLSRKESDPLMPVNLEWILNRALATLEHQLPPRTRVERSFGNVPPIAGHAGKLMQLFLNLIANASHAMGECAREIHVLRVETRARDAQVHVAIGDTGSGIAPEILSRVFDPFFTTKPAGSGTGLGLSISRQLVLDHRGQIEIDSPSGSGATVRLRFPIATAVEMGTASAARPASDVPVCRARVLIVDDERFVRSSLVRSLGPQHDVVGVASVAEAQEVLARGERFHLILCDLIMPQACGGELYEFLQKHRPDCAGSLVFMTGGAFTQQARDAIARAKVRVLLKPLNLHDLRALVADAVKQAHVPGH
jgi:signal transduction histidine kinase